LVGWNVLEYDRTSSQEIRSWTFQTFAEADDFLRKRQEFYKAIGLDKERSFTTPSPEVSQEEIELLEKIMNDPELLESIKRRWGNLAQRKDSNTEF
jgi:arsenate reductase-like glutaredoxin family protein